MSDPSRPPYYPAGSTPAPRPSPEPVAALLAARERAERLLSDAYAYDVISEVEFEQRLDRLRGMDSSAAIDTLLSDLGPVPGQALAAPASVSTIRSVMASTKRDGYWTVPQRLEIRAVMSEVKLDLRLATVPAGCVISVRGIMSSIIITLPPALPVRVEVDSVMSEVKDGAAGNYGASAAGALGIEGRIIMSNLVTRIRALS